MPTYLPTCPKCKHEMTEGFLFDGTDASLGGRSGYSAIWMEGEPDKGWFGFPGKMSDYRDHRQVRAFCCKQCGYLELYALPPDSGT